MCPELQRGPAEVVEEIAHAVGQIEGIDHTRDETHNRSVVTCGGAEPVVRAATAAVGRALELIDMAHRRAPADGAVDVTSSCLWDPRASRSASTWLDASASRSPLASTYRSISTARRRSGRSAGVSPSSDAASTRPCARRSAASASLDFARAPPPARRRGGGRSTQAAHRLNVNLRTDEIGVAIKIGEPARAPAVCRPCRRWASFENPGIADGPGEHEPRRLGADGHPGGRCRGSPAAREAGPTSIIASRRARPPAGALLEVAADARPRRLHARPGPRAVPGARP